MKTSRKIYTEYKENIDNERVEFIRKLLLLSILLGAICLVVQLNVSILVVAIGVSYFVLRYLYEKNLQELNNRYYVLYLKAIVQEELEYNENKRKRRERQQRKKNKYRYNNLELVV